MIVAVMETDLLWQLRESTLFESKNFACLEHVLLRELPIASQVVH